MSDFRDRPSHRGPNREPIPLDCHLEDVANSVAGLVPGHGATPDGNSVRELARRVAFVHDFGKLSSWFQAHFDGDDPTEPTHHAPVGALVAHYVLSVSGFDGDDPLVGFLAVARHHGRLPDTAEYVERSTASMTGSRAKQLFRSDVFAQVDNIDETVPDLADELIRRATDGEGSWAEFRERMDTARENGVHRAVAAHVLSGRALTAREPDRLSDRFYDAVLQVWSALVFADKTSAASLSTGIEMGADAFDATVPSRSAIDAHVEGLLLDAAADDLDETTRQLNQDRERARRRIRGRAEKFARSAESIATLTLPTGLGKTLSGLDAALTVLRQQEGDGRVVYALPFTSIIDQVAEVSRDVFPTEDGGDLLTVDHHLAETVVDLPDDPETVPSDERETLAAMLGESWRSGLVVTTFVQLFESLAGPSNGRSMKLPSLYGSVVVLDEPQALPLDWWPLVERLAETLTERYGATVISMTATQPKLFTADGTPLELIGDPDPYFEPLDRLVFELHHSAEATLDGRTEPVSYEDAARVLTERLDGGSSVLSICNTIDSARELATTLLHRCDAINVNEVYDERLRSHQGVTAELDAGGTIQTVLDRREDGVPLVVHLTTRHRPVDRAHLIEVASTLTERGVPIAFVSTQLVEAGVDVSFDEVVRDFAPLDSLVQAAGRCNRSFDRDRGRVTVWTLAPPQDREETPSTAVYDRQGDSLTKLTALALNQVYDGAPIPEPVVTRDAVEAYFGMLDTRNVGRGEYVDYVDRADAETLGRLSLIDERRAVDVVVARTARESEQLTEVREAVAAFEWDRLDALVDQFSPLQVSIPVYSAADATGPLAHLERLYADAERVQLDTRHGRHTSYFNATEGVRVPDTSAEARLL
ncbi:CRISPR-associated endonuclease Cas3'' [Halobellus sp. GM3]|uniref:CRISPR-associated endonuclease Cas3'' n=1 Tax=Halobellus sp. GM3 TaxID=3458410 RepID=UPI00403DDB0C